MTPGLRRCGADALRDIGATLDAHAADAFSMWRRQRVCALAHDARPCRRRRWLIGRCCCRGITGQKDGARQRRRGQLYSVKVNVATPRAGARSRTVVAWSCCDCDSWLACEDFAHDDGAAAFVLGIFCCRRRLADDAFSAARLISMPPQAYAHRSPACFSVVLAMLILIFKTAGRAAASRKRASRPQFSRREAADGGWRRIFAHVTLVYAIVSAASAAHNVFFATHDAYLHATPPASR